MPLCSIQICSAAKSPPNANTEVSLVKIENLDQEHLTLPIKEFFIFIEVNRLENLTKSRPNSPIIQDGLTDTDKALTTIRRGESSV